jgi:hypothetical protein
VSLNELRALAARWREAADASSRYGGEDATTSTLRVCAQELEDTLASLGLPDIQPVELGNGHVTVSELAGWIGGIAESTVRRWLREGKLEHAWQLDNGEWRVPRVAALAFVESRKSKPPRKRDGKRRYNRAEFVRRFKAKGDNDESESAK